MARLGAMRLGSALFAAAAAVGLGLGLSGAVQAELPRVVSTNLCTDQLVLSLADEAQILSLSWLSADPNESAMADDARRHALNYGTAEELLRLDPDVVIGGAYTRPYALALLERLGLDVVTVDPANDVAGIARNLRRIGAAIGQAERAERLIAAMHERERAIAEAAPARRPAAVLVRPGGYTVGAGSLAHELMSLAGLRNVAAEHGLDRWGSLSVESLLVSDPELLVLIDYYGSSPSLANAVFSHPALERLTRRVAMVEIEAARFACGIPSSLEAARRLQTAAKQAVQR